MPFARVLAAVFAVAIGPTACSRLFATECRCGALGDDAVAATSGWRMEWVVQLPFDSTRSRLVHVATTADLVVAQSDDGGVHAVVASPGPRNGMVAWSKRIEADGGEVLPAAIGPSVVAVASGRSLYGLRIADGSVGFSETSAGFFENGPAVSGDFVFAPIAGGGIRKVTADPTTNVAGSLTLATHGPVHASPFPISSKGIAWINDAGTLVELVPRTDSSTDWTRNSIDLQSPAAGRPVVNGDSMIVVTQVGDLIWLKRPTPRRPAEAKRRKEAEPPIQPPPMQVRWRMPLPSRPDGTLLFDDGVAFVSMGPAGIVAVAIETGLTLWRLEKPMKMLAVGKGGLWCLDAVGRLVLLDAKTGSRLACMDLEGFTLPVVSSQPGRLLLASPEGLLASLAPIDATWRTGPASKNSGAKRPTRQ